MTENRPQLAIPDLNRLHIAVVGLGYVGLPLAATLARHWPVQGFDVNDQRVASIRAGHDSTAELSGEELAAATNLNVSSDPSAVDACNVYIVTVPTPVDKHRKPDLRPLESASETVGARLQRGNIVVFESTVYPGCTEEICVPILEQASGLVFNRDFFVGYSPERINPGDKANRIENITKVVSGSTDAVAELLQNMYGAVVTAGIHKASSIRVAEAAKVIENTQRDVNIALVNELAMIFNRLGIDTQEILQAAGTKWNFLPFRPGLVGGHCISVDPYYLTHKTDEIGYHAQMILAGRRINDQMGSYVAGEILKLMIARDKTIKGSRVLLLGLTFKENCPDIRNTRVVDIVRELQDFGVHVDVHDPWVDGSQAKSQCDVSLVDAPQRGAYDAVVLAVAHTIFVDAGAQTLRQFGNASAIFYDVKSVFERSEVDGRL